MNNIKYVGMAWLLARGSGLKVFHSRWCATRMNIFHRTSLIFDDLSSTRYSPNLFTWPVKKRMRQANVREGSAHSDTLR
jgi:hypothetical protein